MAIALSLFRESPVEVQALLMRYMEKSVGQAHRIEAPEWIDVREVTSVTAPVGFVGGNHARIASSS